MTAKKKTSRKKRAATETRPGPAVPQASEKQLRAAEESMKAATAAVAASVDAVQQSVEGMAKQLQESSETDSS